MKDFLKRRKQKRAAELLRMRQYEANVLHLKMPRRLLELPSRDLYAVEGTTATQISRTPTLQRLDADLGGKLGEHISLSKIQWVDRNVGRRCVFYVLLFFYALFTAFFGGGPGVDFGITRETWPALYMILFPILFLIFAYIGYRVRRGLSKSNLFIVPVFYAIVNLTRESEHDHLMQADQKTLELIEVAARQVERIPNSLARHAPSARSQLAVLAFKKAAYIRSLKLNLLLQTPLSKTDTLHSLSEMIRVAIQTGWQDLPEATPLINRALNRLQRALYIAFAVILFLALLSSGFYGQYLGPAGGIVTFILGLILIYVIGRLGLVVGTLTQAADVAGKLSQQDGK